MDPLHEREQAIAALDKVARAAAEYLTGLDERQVADPAAAKLLDELRQPLPENGLGTLDSVDELLRVGTAAATHSAGPRFFHFVIGGTTPAATAADWVAALLDQNAGLWTSSPLATTLETVTLGWLKDLFGLPPGWGGVLTPSATFANLTGLAAARQWWGSKHGRDVTADGLAGLPAMPVLASGYVHAVRAQGAADPRGRTRHRHPVQPRRRRTGRPRRDGRRAGAARRARGHRCVRR